MKSFVATLVLLGGMLALITLNGIYVDRITTDLLERLENLPEPAAPDCRERVAEIELIWQKNAGIVDLSANHQAIERVEMQISLLREAAEAGSAYDFFAARALLEDALCDIRQFERVSLGQIL